LRDNFRKELKKVDKPRSGDGAPPQTPQRIHFKALQFLRDVMEPGKTSGNIAEQPDSEDTLDENKIKSTFSEDATSETQNPSPCARAPKRKRSTISYQEEMVRLEKRKLEWLTMQEEEEKDEDLNFSGPWFLT
jgi:hypothetical protein